MTVDKVIRGVVTAGFGVGVAAVFGILGAQSADAAPSPSPSPSSPADIARQDAADKRTAQGAKVNSSADDAKQDADDKRTAADAGNSARQQERAQGRKNAEREKAESHESGSKANSSSDDAKQDANDKRKASDSGNSDREDQRARGREKAERKENSSADDQKQDAEDKRTAADAGNPVRKQERAKGKAAAKREADRQEIQREVESFGFAPTDGLATTGAMTDGFAAAADEALDEPGKKARAARDAAYAYVNASKTARKSGVPVSSEERARIADLNAKAKAAADEAKAAMTKAGTLPKGLATVSKIAGKVSPVLVAGSEVYEVAVNDKPVDEAIAEGVGSVAGGILGGIGGGALGSIVPGPGTAIGATGGSLAGGYIGGAAVENSYKWVKEGVSRPGYHRLEK